MAYRIPDKEREPFSVFNCDQMYYVEVDPKALGENFLWRKDPMNAMILAEANGIEGKKRAQQFMKKKYNAIEDFFGDLCFMERDDAQKAIDDYFQPLLTAKKLSGKA